MYGCDRFQNSMLDHLYGLLDPAEQIELRTHLDTCASCRQALDHAREQQRLLATAAKLPFSTVRFEAPAAGRTPEPAVVPLRPIRSRRRVSLGRWYALAAAAAALLISLGGWHLWLLRDQYHSKHQQVVELLAASDEARQEHQAAWEAHLRLQQERERALQAARQEAEAHEMRLLVTGPRSLPPGVAAEYQVRSLDRDGNPVDAELKAQLDRLPLGAQAGHSETESPLPDRADAAPAPIPALASPPGSVPPRASTSKPDGTRGGLNGPAFGAPRPGGSPNPETVSRPSVPPAPLMPPGGGGSGAILPQPKPTQPKENAAKKDQPESDLAMGDALHGLPIKRLAPGTYSVLVPPTLGETTNRSLAIRVAARRKDKDANREEPTISGQVSLSPPEFATYLSTDKPVYQPGEVVRFRSLTLDRATRTPPTQDLTLNYMLIDPAGDRRLVAAGTTALRSNDLKPLLGPDGQPVRGIGTGEFTLPSDAPAGMYSLSLRSNSDVVPEVRRTFWIRDTRKPRLDAKLTLHRSSYAPGEEVQAELVAQRAQGGPLAECPLTATLHIDDVALPAFQTRTSETGHALIRFTLPKQIQRGVAHLSVRLAMEDGPETLTRAVPVVLDRLELDFYPEGGHLIAGLPSRVYFQARTPAGLPAEMRGTLLEDDKPTDIHLATQNDPREPGVNRGLGVFAFTPKPGASYRVRVDAPAHIAAPVALPDMLADGVTLRVEGGVFAASDPIRVHVQSTRPRTLLVAAYSRDTLLASHSLLPGQTDGILRSSDRRGGVCRITVFEAREADTPLGRLHPLAERLVYRQPGNTLQLVAQPDKAHYAPGEQATLRLSAQDENGNRVPAIAQLAVVDQRVHALADDRSTPSLPTYFLLTSELRRSEELEYADFLMGSHPQAATALDLLLGTQGWRRFVEPPATPLGTDRAKAETLADSALRSRREPDLRPTLLNEVIPQQIDLDQQLLDALDREFAEKQQEIATQLAHRQEVLDELTQQARAAHAETAELAALLRQRLCEAGLLFSGSLALLCLWLGWGSGYRGVSLAIAFALSLIAIALAVVPSTHHESADAVATEQAEERLPGGQAGFGGGMGAIPPMPGEPADESPDSGAVPMHPGDNAALDTTPRLLSNDPTQRMERMRQGVWTLSQQLPRELPREAGQKGVQSSKNEHMIVREYAHLRPQHLPAAAPGDFTETIYWHPVLFLNKGEATVSFQLPDSVTRFAITGYAHTPAGQLAATRGEIAVQPPRR